MSNRVAHFEIQADDLERAMEFYKKIFGWEFIEWKGGEKEYWMIMTAPKDSTETGIDGGLLKRPSECDPVKPKQGMTGYVCTIVVENIDDTIKRLEEGGSICALPKMNLAGMAWQAYYIDTEKNIFGIHQPLVKM